MPDPRVGKDKAVFFKYLVLDEQGRTLEQSDLPVGYIHGAGSALLDKLEQELEGRASGEVVDVFVTPEDGFGAHDPNLTFTDDLENVPEELRYLGAEAQMQNEDGDVKNFTVTDIANGKLTVDGNHPFAGKNVIFRVTITEVRAATPAEIASGFPEGQVPQTLH